MVWEAGDLPASLRELRCESTTPDGAEVIGRRYEGQLERLEILDFDMSAAETIEPLIAGDFFAHRLGSRWSPPLFAGERPAEPMWDHPNVELR